MNRWWEVRVACLWVIPQFIIKPSRKNKRVVYALWKRICHLKLWNVLICVVLLFYYSVFYCPVLLFWNDYLNVELSSAVVLKPVLTVSCLAFPSGLFCVVWVEWGPPQQHEPLSLHFDSFLLIFSLFGATLKGSDGSDGPHQRRLLSHLIASFIGSSCLRADLGTRLEVCLCCEIVLLCYRSCRDGKSKWWRARTKQQARGSRGRRRCGRRIAWCCRLFLRQPWRGSRIGSGLWREAEISTKRNL